MAVKKISLPVLQPGQEVSIPNCVETAKVIERVGTCLYKLQYKEHVITLHRSRIGVKVAGRWVNF